MVTQSAENPETTQHDDFTENFKHLQAVRVQVVRNLAVGEYGRIIHDFYHAILLELLDKVSAHDFAQALAVAKGKVLEASRG